MATTQMNVRIDEELKARGDRVLATVQLTPTQVVRQLYLRISEGGDKAEEFLSLLLARDGDGGRERLAVAEEGWSLCGAGLEALGVAQLSRGAWDDGEMLEDELFERMGERGYL